MRLSKKVEYGIVALIELAGQSLAMEQSRLLSLRQISTRSGIPLKFLEQIMMILKNARLVKSVRGKEGGYELARRPNEIFVGEAMRAIDGTVAPFGSEAEISKQIIENENYSGLYTLLLDARNAIATIMDHTSLSDLCTRTLEHKENKRKIPMYYI